MLKVPHFKLDYSSLNLTEFPFSMSADKRYFWKSAQHEVATESMERVVALRLGIGVVDGPNGVGKSTNARYLADELRELPDQYRAVYIHTPLWETRRKASEAIAAEFGIPGMRSEIDLLRNFERLLIEEYQQGRSAVVIIDDAHLMSPSALKTIQYLYNFDRSSKLVQIILFGQTELRNLILKNRALYDRVHAWQRLEPLSPSDALAMIAHRCKVAGRTEPLLDEDAFTQLYDYTEGIPRRIVNVCGFLIKHLIDQNQFTAAAEDMQVAIKEYARRPAEDEVSRRPVKRYPKRAGKAKPAKKVSRKKR